MPAQTRKEQDKKAQLERQATLALALRELVNALLPDVIPVIQDLRDGVCVVRLGESDLDDSYIPLPFYDGGYKQAAIKNGASSESLTEDEKRQDSLQTGMVTAEGFVSLIHRINQLNSKREPLVLVIKPVGSELVYRNSVDSASRNTIVVNQKGNHYFPEGKESSDITTKNNSCAFASVLSWMEEHDKVDRLQPLIDEGIEKGVDAECLATLQNFVGGVDLSSSSDEECSSDDESLTSVQTDDAYVALFSRMAHVVMGESDEAEKQYKELLYISMAAARDESIDDRAVHPVSQQDMSLFVKEQARLLKFYNQKKAEADSRSRSSSDASDNKQADTDLWALD